MNSAIKQANENIIQISDRFHLLKGLTGAAKKVMTSLIDANIGIPVSTSHYEGNEATDYWEKEIERQDFPAREDNVNCARKKKTIEKVLLLTEQGLRRTEIAAEPGLSYGTVKRYQSSDLNPVHGRYNTTRGSKIKPYAEKSTNSGKNRLCSTYGVEFGISGCKHKDTGFLCAAN